MKAKANKESKVVASLFAAKQAVLSEDKGLCFLKAMLLSKLMSVLVSMYF